MKSKSTKQHGTGKGSGMQKTSTGSSSRPGGKGKYPINSSAPGDMGLSARKPSGGRTLT
jgi:hypothetical protein